MNKEQKEIEKTRKKIIKDLRGGEPFSYERSGDYLVIGVRMAFGKTTDEFEVYVCPQYDMTDSGIIAKRLDTLKKEKKE